MKYILITGGVISGLGKGVITSSTGYLLKHQYYVTAIKIDPYLNIDAGTISPLEHGEVFVLDDGSETDLDLGTYERFLDINLTYKHNITTGKIYDTVLKRERRGNFLGETIQVIPHITNTIINWISTAAHIDVSNHAIGMSPEICMIELGGTVGDIEGAAFIEALRQLRFSVGEGNFCHLHVSLVPIVGEPKTKPTQHGIRILRSMGMTPDFIMCRCKTDLSPAIKNKISAFCMIPEECVISVRDVSDIYSVPKLLRSQLVDVSILNKLKLNPVIHVNRSLTSIDQIPSTRRPITIGIVGKYSKTPDAYLSILKALEHCSKHHEIKINSIIVDSGDLNATSFDLMSFDGIIIPGGFGSSKIDGKIRAAKYARENKIPCLGICLGMQIMVIEFSRNVLGLKNANSTEFDSLTSAPVVINMPEISIDNLGGTMRLGLHTTIIRDSRAKKIYGKSVNRRHRHRYEINPAMTEKIERAGLFFSGTDKSGRRMEILELNSHPFYIGTQFHPEYSSRYGDPEPLFIEFIRTVVI